MSDVFSRSLTASTQREQARLDQVKNNAGGFVFAVSDKVRLERFLIVGTEKGTYYQDEKPLTRENVNFLIDLIDRDEQLVIDTVLEVSESGRAFRNKYAVFVVAALGKYGKKRDLSSLVQRVCRTSTMLYEFAKYLELINGGGGWGKTKRRAVADWYTHKTPDQLAYQAVKYRQRDGWTHRDMFRLSHVKGSFVPGIGEFILGKTGFDSGEHQLVAGFKIAQAAPNVEELLNVLEAVPGLPWEVVPTQYHKEPRVWHQLYRNGQLTGQALVRNITRFARLGMFNDMVFAREIATALTNETMIQKTRLHPIQFLLALMVHTKGQIARETQGGYKYPMGFGGPAAYKPKDWTTSPVIVDALNDAFYKSFSYVEPSNKRFFIGLDVSGSMKQAASGLDLTAAELGAAMVLSVAKTEPFYLAFGFSDVMKDLGISPGMRLDDVLRITNSMSFGRTDCAQPMLYAAKHNIAVDTFMIYTDNETWFGDVHPFQAIKQYRQKTGIDAKLIVAAASATNFTIADPSDRGMLDVVGGDANLPALVSQFSAGNI